MAKVLFVNPVVREEDVPRHVPYGIALLSALAMRAGHSVQVYDANAWRLGDHVLAEVLKADDWDVVAAGGISTTYGFVKRFARIARTLAPSAKIIMGGGLLTAMPRDIMRLIPQADAGVVGEAYVTFNELLAQISAGVWEPERVDGVISRRPDGELILTNPRTLVENLDEFLPYPAYDLFPLEEVYFKNSQVLFSEEGMTATRRLDINASYGCSLVCKFCFHLGISGDMKYSTSPAETRDVIFDAPGTYSRQIRYHSPQYIVTLVKSLRERYNIDFITFLDENLMTMDMFSRRKWLKEICRLWIEQGLQPSCIRDGVPHDRSCQGVHWSGTSHATLCTPEVLRMMRQAGCSHLVYGYESFSKQILKRLGKGSTPETNLKSFFWTLDAGIRPIPNQIIGFPTEDFDSIRDDMDAWQKLGIVVKPFFATPYPGSEWYHTYKDSILAQWGDDLDGFLGALGDATKITAVISHNFNAVELLGLRELMIAGDYRRIAEYEREWNLRHPVRDAKALAKQAEDARRPDASTLQPTRARVIPLTLNA